MMGRYTLKLLLSKEVIVLNFLINIYIYIQRTHFDLFLYIIRILIILLYDGAPFLFLGVLRLEDLLTVEGRGWLRLAVYENKNK